MKKSCHHSVLSIKIKFTRFPSRHFEILILYINVETCPLYLLHERVGGGSRASPVRAPFLSRCLQLTQLTTRSMISIELGYTEKDVEKKTVNLREGENFNPAFLKIVSSLQNHVPPTF